MIETLSVAIFCYETRPVLDQDNICDEIGFAQTTIERNRERAKAGNQWEESTLKGCH